MDDNDDNLYGNVKKMKRFFENTSHVNSNRQITQDNVNNVTNSNRE